MFKGLIDKFESQYLKKSIPDFSSGDTLQIQLWIVEGSKKRLQTFTGSVIARRNRGLNSSFTLRKQSPACTIERVFKLHSPILENLTVIRRGRVRRAKLYYLRQYQGKAARIKEYVVSKKQKS